MMFILVLLFSGNVFAQDEDTTAAEPDTISWYLNYDEALALAAGEGRYMLIDFYTDWCRWCKYLDSVTYSEPLIVSLSKSFVFTKLNAEVDTNTARKYGVSGFPTVVITKPNGVEVDRLVGAYPPEEFLPALFDLMMNRNTLDDLLTKAIQYPDSMQLLFDIAQNYGSKSDRPNANYYYNLLMERDPENNAGLNPDAWMEMAYLKSKDKDIDGAVAMYMEFEQKFPDNENIEMSKMMIPYVYHRAKDYKNAEKYYKQFKKEFPESERLEWIDKQLEKIKEDKKKK